MNTASHSRPPLTADGCRSLTALVLLALPAIASGDTLLSNCTFPALSNAVQRGGLITFDCDARIFFSNRLVIETDTTLDAAGRTVVFDGRTGTNSTRAVRLFVVKPGVEFKINGIALVNGRAQTTAGAIHNSGTLILNHCLLSNHVAVGANGVAGNDGSSGGNIGDHGSAGGPGVAASAGAILNLGTAWITQCQFATNTAFGGNGGDGGSGGDGDVYGGDGANGGDGAAAHGGAIMNQGTLRITNSLFQLNSAVGGAGGNGGTNGTGPFPGARGNGGKGGVASGGGILTTGNSLLDGCTLFDNAVFGGDSADLGSRGSAGDTGWNGSDASGGGVWNMGVATLLNCTLFRNAASGGNAGRGESSETVAGDGGNGGSAWGGSLFNQAVVRLTNCTVSTGAVVPGAGAEAGSGPFAGEPGQDGAGYGWNLANYGTTFVLRGCILDQAGSGVGVVATTNIVRVVRTEPVTVTNINPRETAVALIDSTCAIAARCSSNLISASTPVLQPETFFATNTFITSNCLVSTPTLTCLTSIWIARFTTTNVPVATNYVTNITYVTNVVTFRNAFGTFTDGGYNLSDDGTPAFVIPGSRSHNNRDALLGTYGDHGGFTPTIPLQAGSPAVDAIRGGSFPPMDQRGEPRPSGSGADIGAFEAAGLLIESQPVSQTVTVGGQATFSVAARGDPPLTYQWRFNGTNVSGATGATLRLTNIPPAFAGVYSVVVRSGSGASLTSSNATLTVITQPVLVNAEISSNRFRVSFLTSSNRNYFLEFQTALQSVRWLDATNARGNGGLLQLQDPQPVAGSRFYRVRVE